MIDFISGAFNAVSDFIKTIQQVVTTSVDVINVMVSFVPTPFREITLTFVAIVVGIMIYKVVRN